MTALSEILVRANSGDRSAREIARQAQSAGYSLNHDTVARYLRGDHGRPDEPTLRAFAAVLAVSLTDLRSAAELPSDAIDPYVPPTESSRLTRRQRKAVDEIIRAMLDTPATTGVTAIRPRSGRSGTGRAVAATGDAGTDTAALDTARKAARRGGSDRKA